MKPKSTLRTLLLSSTALLSLPALHATNLYWDTNAAAGFGAIGPFTWNNTNLFWNTDVTGATGGTFTANPTNADDLFINGGTTGTITLSGTQVASSLTFANNVAKTLSSGTSLTVGGTGTRSGIFVNSGDNAANTISSLLTLNSASTAVNFTNAGTGTLTIGAVTGSASSGTQTINVNPVSGNITLNGIIGNGGAGGVVGLTLNSSGGGGAITLSGANTYTGATNIVAGTTTISNASTFTNTSAISLGQAARLTVNANNSSLAKLSTAGGGSGVTAGSFLRYSTAQTAAGASNGPGTIFGAVELNLTNVNPNYVLDFGSGGALTNLVTSTYTSALTLSGTASIDASAAVATYSAGGITGSTSGTKTLNLTGSNAGANTISSAIGNGSGTIGVTKGGIGTWTLSGTNTYTGNTLVSGGILKFATPASLYNNEAAAAWSNTNIDVETGATMAFNIGGADFTKANINSLLALSNSASNGFNSGSSLGLDTTNGSFLFDSAINNPNSGANVLGLTKLGINTLTLDQDNTYTGRTVISAGTLQLGNGSTTGKLSTSSSILNNGNLTINRSDAVAQGTDFSAAPITGTGSFTQAGSGTTTLSAANTFSGTTTVSAGVLNLTNALALQNSALVTTGGGTVTFTGFTDPIFGGLSGASDIISISPAFSAGALTLNPQSGATFTYGGVIADGAPGMSLTKNGAGTQILTGANLYTGTTIVNRGTLTIGNGTTGSLNGTTGTALTFTGTGTFNVAEAASSTQGMGALTLSAGDATITSTGIAAQNSTLTFASLAARPAGATANFTLATNTTAAQNQIVLTSTTNAPLDNSGSNNQGMFFGTTEYARYDTTNNRFRAVIYGTDTNASAIVATGATLGIDDATKDVKVSGNITAQTTASVNTLNLAATTMTLSSTAQVLSVNGILSNGGTLTTTGFVKTTPATTAGKIQPATAGGELVINAAGNLTLSASIQDNTSASSLTKSGAGILTLGSSASTYSGATVVNAGTVSFTDNQGANTDTFFGTGPVTFNPGTTMAMNRTYVGNSLTLNNATVTAGNSFGSNLAGTTTLTGISTISITGNLNISGNLTGTGGLIKTGTTVVPVNGNNNYTGPTIISGGGLTFLKPASLYNGDSLQWTKSNITVNNGGSLTLKIGGTGEFTITQASTIFGNLVSDVNGNGLQAGAFFGVDAGTSGGSFTLATNLTDSAGVGSGAVGIRFFGNNSMGASTLELTGTNTYSGQTIIDRQGLLKVTSINSVFTNAALGTVHSASSSLGAPTTVANGTIQLGTPASFQGAGLLYVGTGETTDRVLSLGGGGGDNYRLDQSGTGLLKFISNMVMTDTRGVKNIFLQGSTTGAGEIAGVIPNATSATPTTTLTKSGTGIWTLSGTNLYTGATTINGGTLRFARQVSLYNNDEANWIKTKIIVNSGATLALNVGGTGEFTTSNVTTLLTNLGVGITNNGLRSGSSVGFDTTNAAGGTFTVANAIANSTGTGSGAVGVTKLGTNTLILTGPNTYTGGTSIAAGTVVAGSPSAFSTGAVSVSSGATLDLGGQTLTNVFTLPSGSILTGAGTITAPSDTIASIVNPGSTTGTLNFTNTAVTLAGPVNLEIGGTAGGSYDMVTCTAGPITVAATAVVSVSLVNGFVPAAGNSWTFFLGDGDFASTGTLNLPVLAPNLQWNSSSFATTGAVSIQQVTLGASATVSSFAENAASPASVVTVSVPVPPLADLVVAISATANGDEVTVPGTVTILAGQTSATFDVAAVNDGIADGNQVVTLGFSATGYTNGTTNLTVTDVGGSDPVAAYTATFGLTGNNALPDADPDGDGISNAMEYALGINPTANNGPEYRGIASTASGALTLTYRRPLNGVSGVTYGVEFKTADLVVGNTGWSTGILNTDYTQSVTPNGDGTTETVTITLTGVVSGKKFARVAATF